MRKEIDILAALDVVEMDRSWAGKILKSATYETAVKNLAIFKKELKEKKTKLLFKYHPDVNKDEDSTEKFKEINEAASIL